jgi:hypothetical protein
MPEREHSNTLKYSKLFVENQQIMEHSKLLMVPDYVRKSLQETCQASYLMPRQDRAVSRSPR